MLGWSNTKIVRKVVADLISGFLNTVPGVSHTGRHVDAYLVVTIVVFFFFWGGKYFLTFFCFSLDEGDVFWTILIVR